MAGNERHQNRPRRVAVLGSTGSIGAQTLDVIRRHPDKLQVVALAAGSRADEMMAQAAVFGVKYCAIGDVGAKPGVAVPAGTEVAWGPQAVADLVRLSEVDIVVNALVGAAGLQASHDTLHAGKVLALANKESLVVGGDLIMPLARSAILRTAEPRMSHPDAALSPCADHSAFGSAAGLTHAPESTSLTQSPCQNSMADSITLTQSLYRDAPCGALMPIDSEHGAIYQCLLGERHEEVNCLWVTASGGPFRGMTRDQLGAITPEQALAHPTWNMGPKITIDSSTLMNKGLEVIEAHHLFNMPYDRIKVVVQPQSAIHSMVEYSDGSVKAHLGTTDMRIPIQFALSYPDRWDAPVQPLDFCQLRSLEFYPPDTDTFRCLALAREAGMRGGTLPCAMNAANEVAVAAFLDRRCGYLGIADTVETVMDKHSVEQVTGLEQLQGVDAWARRAAAEYLGIRAR